MRRTEMYDECFSDADNKEDRLSEGTLGLGYILEGQSHTLF